jgi:ferredoxin
MQEAGGSQMRRLTETIRARARELLKDKTVVRVLGWSKGEFCYDPAPAFFETEEQLDDLVYDNFSASMLSKYLIEAGKREGKTLVLLKPCDTYNYNLLLKERKVVREKAYIIGVGCGGMLDVEKIKLHETRGLKSAEVEEDGAGKSVVIHAVSGDKTLAKDDVLLEKCRSCKGLEHKVYDERIGADNVINWKRSNRFTAVEKLEKMTPDERFAHWRKELSRCIRCNACRNACPVCSCNQCVFDNPGSGVTSKANANSFEENLYHIIRAFHVAGRCTDCGECSRVCPQNIPLHLLNRKFIKDIDLFYGEYQSGADSEGKTPLTEYDVGDPEPGATHKQGGAW